MSRMRMDLERIWVSSRCVVRADRQLDVVGLPPVIVSVPTSRMHRAGVPTRTCARSPGQAGTPPGHTIGTPVPSARDSGPPTIGSWTGGMRMEQFDHRSKIVAHRTQSRLGAVCHRRRRRDGRPGSCCSGSGWPTTAQEPAGLNWWFVTWFCVGLAYSAVGAALVARSSRRRLGAVLPHRRWLGGRERDRHRVPPLRLDRGS